MQVLEAARGPQDEAFEGAVCKGLLCLSPRNAICTLESRQSLQAKFVGCSAGSSGTHTCSPCAHGSFSQRQPARRATSLARLERRASLLSITLPFWQSTSRSTDVQAEQALRMRYTQISQIFYPFLFFPLLFFPPALQSRTSSQQRCVTLEASHKCPTYFSFAFLQMPHIFFLCFPSRFPPFFPSLSVES